MKTIPASDVRMHTVEELIEWSHDIALCTKKGKYKLSKIRILYTWLSISVEKLDEVLKEAKNE